MHLGGAGLAVAAAAQFAPGRSGAKPPKPQATFRDGEAMESTNWEGNFSKVGIDLCHADWEAWRRLN